MFLAVFAETDLRHLNPSLSYVIIFVTTFFNIQTKRRIVTHYKVKKKKNYLEMVSTTKTASFLTQLRACESATI